MRTTLGARARRGAADARRVRARDAARRAGDLPEGPRADPDARRRLPRRARPRVGRRLGRADDDAAARDRARPGHVTRLRAPRRLRRPRAAATSRASSAPTSRSTSRSATSTTASTSTDLDRVAPRPARAVAGREARRGARCARAGSCSSYLPTIGQVARLREELDGVGVRHGRDARGAPARLARRRPVGPARPPHGRPHRLPHPRAPARPAERRERPRRSIVARRLAAGGGRAGLPARVRRAGCCRGPGSPLGVVVGDRCSSTTSSTRSAATAPRDRVARRALAFVVLVATVGQALGLAVGVARATGSAPRPAACTGGDRVGGAVVGVAGVLVAGLAAHPRARERAGLAGAARRATRAIVARDRPRRARPAADASRRSAGWSATSRSPRCSTPLDARPTPGRRPTTGSPPTVDARVRASIVKVEGAACDRIQDGTGFVAGADLVVTNAHVVAGERDTDGRSRRRRASSTPTSSRSTRTATSRCCASPGSTLPALAARRRPTSDDVGAVFGHPGGGPLRAVAGAHRRADRRARHRHLPHRRRPRGDVFVLAAALRPGRLRRRARRRATGGSSASRSRSTPAATATAYALTVDELDAVLDAVRPARARRHRRVPRRLTPGPTERARVGPGLRVTGGVDRSVSRPR